MKQVATVRKMCGDRAWLVWLETWSLNCCDILSATVFSFILCRASTRVHQDGFRVGHLCHSWSISHLHLHYSLLMGRPSCSPSWYQDFTNVHGKFSPGHIKRKKHSQAQVAANASFSIWKSRWSKLGLNCWNGFTTTFVICRGIAKNLMHHLE